MRIALVTDTYAPRVGGIEGQVAGLADALRGAGHDVDVLTATAGPEGRGVLRFPGIVGAVPNPLSRGRVKDTLAGYDVVHAHMGVLAPFAQAAAADALALRRPVVVTVHSMLAAAGPLLAPLLHHWVEAGAVISAVSPVAARDVENACGAEVLVLPNAIDVAAWAPRGVRPPGAPTFVCTSRLAERKRVVPLVRAFARVPAPARLVVVGTGPQAGLVRAACARHDVEDRVETTGLVRRESLREILWGADAFVSPVRLEAFGIAALEARAAGLPVIGYRTSGVAGLVDDGRTGLLVDGDTGLAAAMTRLATDPDLLRSLRETCRAEPPPCDWSDALPATLGAYAEAGYAIGRVPR